MVVLKVMVTAKVHNFRMIMAVRMISNSGSVVNLFADKLVSGWVLVLKLTCSDSVLTSDS